MKILLVIDLQREFMDSDGNYEKILNFVKNSKEYDKIIATICYNNNNTSFIKYDVWKDSLDNISSLEFNSDLVLLKSCYGLQDYSILDKKNKYDLVGFNTEACVLKIALDLFDRGYDFRVLSSFCYSSLGQEFHNLGCDLLKSMIGTAFVD